MRNNVLFPAPSTPVGRTGMRKPFDVLAEGLLFCPGNDASPGTRTQTSQLWRFLPSGVAAAARSSASRPPLRPADPASASARPWLRGVPSSPGSSLVANGNDDLVCHLAPVHFRVENQSRH